MSEEPPSLERIAELVRETYERVEEARIRLGALVKDMTAAIEKLEKGLKQGDKHTVDTAIDELKLHVKYLDRVIYSHILAAVVKASWADLKLTELLDEERKKKAEKPEAKPTPPPVTPS